MISGTVKTMMYRRPIVERVLEVNAEAVAKYLSAQIDAGAQAIQIFDTWRRVCLWRLPAILFALYPKGA